jgi:hypothetical protein
MRRCPYCCVLPRTSAFRSAARADGGDYQAITRTGMRLPRYVIVCRATRLPSDSGYWATCDHGYS